MPTPRLVTDSLGNQVVDSNGMPVEVAAETEWTYLPVAPDDVCFARQANEIRDAIIDSNEIVGSPIGAEALLARVYPEGYDADARGPELDIIKYEWLAAARANIETLLDYYGRAVEGDGPTCTFQVWTKAALLQEVHDDETFYTPDLISDPEDWTDAQADDGTPAEYPDPDIIWADHINELYYCLQRFLIAEVELTPTFVTRESKYVDSGEEATEQEALDDAIAQFNAAGWGSSSFAYALSLSLLEASGGGYHCEMRQERMKDVTYAPPALPAGCALDYLILDHWAEVSDAGSDVDPPAVFDEADYGGDAPRDKTVWRGNPGAFYREGFVAFDNAVAGETHHHSWYSFSPPAVGEPAARSHTNFTYIGTKNASGNITRVLLAIRPRKYTGNYHLTLWPWAG